LLLFAGLIPAVPAQQTEPGDCPSNPGPNEVIVCAVTKDVVGGVYHLAGAASVETTQAKLWAEEIDYDENTGEAAARGNVYVKYFEKGEEMWADRAEYNLQTDTGRFYNVHGTTPARVDPRPRLLVTSNPFYFEGNWAERIKRKVVLYHGFVTDCTVPRPWWVLSASRFDIVPHERALAHGAVFRVRSVPVFYAPALYKSLEERPRRSGFLTPNAGNSSRRGKMVGIGYFWAINRTYDATYRPQWFTQRGFAHTVDFRGKPSQRSSFNFFLYGVNDKGLELASGERRKEGGFIVGMAGSADLKWGWSARGDLNYLTSMRFRRAFTESYYEAIDAEVHSTGFVGKHTNSYGLDIVFARLENIQEAGAYNSALNEYAPDSKVMIRKLPEAQFISRPRELLKSKFPLFFSLESTAGLLRRNQPLFQTRQMVPRIDLQPRLMTTARWKGFSLLPSFSARASYYGSSQEKGFLAGADVTRTSREITLDIVPPALARVYERPSWLGDKVKHVIEPRIFFRHAAGVDDFEKLIRFDDTELLSNTTEVDLSITNRLYAKRGTETVEVLSWQVSQRRYFDSTFGGAVDVLNPSTGEPGRRVLLSSLQVSGYAFLYGPRNYSPVISALRVSLPVGAGLEWRGDYDPLLNRPTNSVVSADLRRGIYSFSIGHSYNRSGPQLSPSANQLRGMVTVGNDNRRGWNAAFSALYDCRTGVMQLANTQITYNTDCCGFSVQYRRFSIGDRNENQFRMSFSVANIGSLGTLKKQDRLF
jgi:LPS-assembly protein